MNHENSFVVRRFENRNGVISWRVAGWLHGVRIRKNYKSKEEAAAEKATLELKAVQTTAGLRSATTFLVDEQLRQAEAVFRRLTGSAHSLSFCVEYALTNYKPPTHQKLLADAVTAYLAVKTAEHDQKLISPSMLTTIKRHMAALKKKFPGVSVSDLTAAQLTPYFQRGKACLKTYNNRRGLVSTFLKYAE
jgi:hypothetical protein